MDGAGHDVVAAMMSLQVLGVQAIQSFGYAVLRKLVVLLLRARQLLRIYVQATSARHGGQHDDAHFRCLASLLHLRHKELGHQEVAQVVCREHQLETLGGREPLGGRHDAGVANQIMERQAQRQEVFNEGLDGPQVRELDLQDRGLALELPLSLLQSLQRGGGLVRTSHRPHHMAAVFHHTPRVLQAEAVAGAGNDSHLAQQGGVISLAARSLHDLFACVAPVRGEGFVAAHPREASDEGTQIHASPDVGYAPEIPQHLEEVRPRHNLSPASAQKPRDGRCRGGHEREVPPAARDVTSAGTVWLRHGGCNAARARAHLGVVNPFGATRQRSCLKP
mmetsp:Transcript_37946/g.114655  ORF Transcript_37946/g.114655 Transcript_37946/m.114655 type:complete len:335 (-) Transcript_37946:9-1013(-)